MLATAQTCNVPVLKVLAQKSLGLTVMEKSLPDYEKRSGTVGQVSCRFAQAARANVAHHRKPGGCFKRTRQMKARHAPAIGDFVQRQRAGKVTFDKPERFSDGIHFGSHVCMKPA